MKGGKSWDGGGRGNVSARRAYICDERRSKQIRISTLAHGTTLLISIQGQVVVERRRHCSKNIGLRHRSSGFHPSRRLHSIRTSSSSSSSSGGDSRRGKVAGIGRGESSSACPRRTWAEEVAKTASDDADDRCARREMNCRQFAV